MQGNPLFVSAVLEAAVVLLLAHPALPESAASKAVPTASAAVPANPLPKIAPILGSDVGAFKPGAQQVAVAKIGSDINALIERLEQLPMYIAWGCANPSNPGGSLNRLWARPDLQPPAIAQPAPKVTLTASGITLTFRGGDWSHAIFLAPAAGDKAGERTLSFPATTEIGATCTPYFIIEPY